MKSISDGFDSANDSIALLNRENEALKKRVERLENSEYIKSLNEMIVLQEKQITLLESRLNQSQESKKIAGSALSPPVASANKVSTIASEVGANNSLQENVIAPTAVQEGQKKTNTMAISP